MVNPMGSKGQLALAFANILRDMWQGEMQCLTPLPFRVRLVHILAQCFPLTVLLANDVHLCEAILRVGAARLARVPQRPP